MLRLWAGYGIVIPGMGGEGVRDRDKAHKA
jgi:hypothetical protein